MNATALFLKSGQPAGIYYCSQCKIVRPTQADAEKCCQHYKCDTCGKVIDSFWTRCRGCADRIAIDSAEKLDTWDGQVFWCDQYYDSVYEFAAESIGDGFQLPDFVFIAEEESFPCVDESSIFEQIAEQMFEGAENHFSGVDEFAAACRAFEKANATLKSYQVNHKKMVRVPKEPKEVV